jgi:hypothetical protein
MTARQPAHKEPEQESQLVPVPLAPEEKKGRHEPARRGTRPLADGLAPRPGVAGPGYYAVALLAGVVGQAPTPPQGDRI